jgi:hypothetical protein
MISPELKNMQYFAKLIKLLNKSKNEDREVILEHLNGNSINYLCEIIYNIIGGNVKLSKRQINKLRSELQHNKKCYRYLSKKGGNEERKRKLIKQNGRGIGTILSIALPIILQLITQMLTKKNKK